MCSFYEFQDCIKLRSCLSFPLCLAWVESMAIMVYGKKQLYGSEVWKLNCMHKVMLMSINLGNTIEYFKALGK
jgi:hypothetical protein